MSGCWIAGPITLTDVCVVGAGPAGSTAAMLLARLGYSVIVREKQTFPRAHAGESLPPSILPILGRLGVREAVEGAGFLRPRGAHVLWSGDSPEWAGTSGDQPGFQVDRARFDQILLDAAIAAGARLLPAASADSIGAEARMAVDASGRRRVMSPRAEAFAPETLAVYAYWRQPEGMSPETLVEAGTHHWYWGAPLPDGTFNATVFVSPIEFAGRSAGELYGAKLRESILMGPHCLERVSPILVCDATPRVCSAPLVTANRIMAGESAFSIDPLSSQGVMAAMRSGIHAAAAVHTILAHADCALAAEFIESRARATVRSHARLAARGYRDSGRESAFWRERSSCRWPAVEAGPIPGLDSSVTLAEGVALRGVPFLAGDRIVAVDGIAGGSLEEPMVELGGHSVASLLRPVANRPCSARDLLEIWSRRMPARDAVRVFEHLWKAGVLATSRCA